MREDSQPAGEYGNTSQVIAASVAAGCCFSEWCRSDPLWPIDGSAVGSGAARGEPEVWRFAWVGAERISHPPELTSMAAIRGWSVLSYADHRSNGHTAMAAACAEAYRATPHGQPVVLPHGAA